MKLNSAERDYYVQELAVDPPLSGTWEASFDDEETWVDGVEGEDGYWSWLVAGPDFDAESVGMDAADTAAVIPQTLRPKLRLKDSPVLDVTDGTLIELIR